MTYAEAVEALYRLKEDKSFIEREIKKLTRVVLDSQEAQASVLLLSNQGGERTDQGVTYEVKRSYEQIQRMGHAQSHQCSDFFERLGN